MDRRQRFLDLKAHPLYSIALKKLTLPERDLMDKFLNDHLAESSSVWSIGVRKLFVDNPNKPKNWTVIYEALQVLA